MYYTYINRNPHFPLGISLEVTLEVYYPSLVIQMEQTAHSLMSFVSSVKVGDVQHMILHVTQDHFLAFTQPLYNEALHLPSLSLQYKFCGIKGRTYEVLVSNYLLILARSTSVVMRLFASDKTLAP